MDGKFSIGSVNRPWRFDYGRRLRLWLTVVVVLATSSASQGQLRTVAFVGDEAPGAPAGAQFLGFGIPGMNDWGEVIFLAGLEQGPGGVTSANDRGYWSEVTGALDVVALEGDLAPDIPNNVPFGNNFDTIGFITNSDHVFVANSLPQGGDITSDNAYGFWRGQNGTLTLVHREGDPPPGTAGVESLGLFPIVNSLGEVTAVSSLRQGVGGVTDENDQVIWTDRGGVPSLIAREGDAPPGMPGAVYEFLSAPTMNDWSHIAYGADLLEGMGGVTEDDDSTLWSDRGGTFEIVYREGEEAPGVPGSQFELLYSPQISHLGRLIFKAEMKEGEGGVTADDKVGLWAEDEVGLQLLARQGDPAPGLTDVVFDDINSSWITIQPNDSGAVAFAASLDAPGTDEDGISVWLAGTGPPSLVMRRGDPAPGAGEDVTFNNLLTILTLRLNNRGQTAFAATVEGPGVGVNDFGIWAQDIHGDLQLIAMEGKMLEVAPGDMREVSALFFGEFNNRGELAFYAGFTDGSNGVFVSSVVAVPEPSTLALLMFAGLVLVAGRLWGGTARPREQSIVPQDSQLAARSRYSFNPGRPLVSQLAVNGAVRSQS